MRALMYLLDGPMVLKAIQPLSPLKAPQEVMIDNEGIHLSRKAQGIIPGPFNLLCVEPVKVEGRAACEDNVWFPGEYLGDGLTIEQLYIRGMYKGEVILDFGHNHRLKLFGCSMGHRL